MTSALLQEAMLAAVWRTSWRCERARRGTKQGSEDGAEEANRKKMPEEEVRGVNTPVSFHHGSHGGYVAEVLLVLLLSPSSSAVFHRRTGLHSS